MRSITEMRLTATRLSTQRRRTLTASKEFQGGFHDFIQEGQDRTAFIVEGLALRGVKSTVINMDERRHVLVNFPKSQYDGYFRIKTLIAHYDRIPKSPGANDNSFAVYRMIEWAKKLNALPYAHNIRLIFTDGEEFSGKHGGAKNSGEALSSQGSFMLAETFRRLGIKNDDVFVFDCMGRGTIPVLQKEAVLVGADFPFKKKFRALHERTKSLLHAATGGKWVTLPVPWSDNAGFLASGLPCVLVTMLPSDEASSYMMDLAKNPGLEDFVLNGRKNTPDAERFKNLMPATWRLINSEHDREETLTPEAAAVFEKILDAVADLKSLP